MAPPVPKKKPKPVPVVPPKKKVKPPPPPPQLILTVEVIEVLTGDAIQNATVEVQGKFKGPTKKNGKVTLAPMAPGTFNILVFKKGHGPVPATKTDAFTPDVNVIQNNVALTAGPHTVTVKMCDGTGQLLVKVKRTVNNALVALPQAEVEFTGQPKVATPDDGERFFKKVKAGKVTVKAGKVGYGPQRKLATDPFVFGPTTKDVSVPAGHPEQVELLMENPGNTVTKIFATIKDTVGLLAVGPPLGEPAAAAGNQRLRSSTSNVLALGTNTPVVLVRGCNKVALTAGTTPAGKGVGWEVKLNDSKGAIPTITPSADANSATLNSDKGGSFAVIAADGESKIIWNVVFVHVKVDVKSSVGRIKTQKTFYKQIPTPGRCDVGSGNFVTDQAAWQAKVDMVVVGGGADNSVGAPKINLHYFQNGVVPVNDSGAFTGPPPAGSAVNVTGAVTETPPNLPILDATGPVGPAPPLVPHISDTSNAPPTIHGAPSFILTSLGNRKFTIQSLDSPGIGIPFRHPTKAANLRTITGNRSFRATIAVTSQDAVNNLVVVAALRWHATYDGTVTYPAGSPAPPALVAAGVAGKWVGTTNTVVSDPQYALVSDATGGLDAAVAGFRITTPRFNSAAGFKLVNS